MPAGLLGKVALKTGRSYSSLPRPILKRGWAGLGLWSLCQDGRLPLLMASSQSLCYAPSPQQCGVYLQMHSDLDVALEASI